MNSIASIIAITTTMLASQAAAAPLSNNFAPVGYVEAECHAATRTLSAFEPTGYTYMHQRYPDWACIEAGGDDISCAEPTFVRSVWQNLDNLPFFGRRGWSGKLSVDVFRNIPAGEGCWTATEIHTPLGILEPNFDEDNGKFKDTAKEGVVLIGG